MAFIYLFVCLFRSSPEDVFTEFRERGRERRGNIDVREKC